MTKFNIIYFFVIKISKKKQTGYASSAHGARAVLVHSIAESLASSVPLLNNSINFYTHKIKIKYNFQFHTK
jgi:hypothetical protein